MTSTGKTAVTKDVLAGEVGLGIVAAALERAAQTANVVLDGVAADEAG